MKKRILPLAVALFFLLTACGTGDSPQTTPPLSETPSAEQPTPTPPPTPEPTPTPEPVHEHVWTEANYQEPKTCSDCGETEGDPLTPALRDSINMILGTTYEYTTLTYGDPSLETVGNLTVTDCKIIESDETHPAKDGYEWRIVRFTWKFSDDNARKQGMMYRVEAVDYYTGDRKEYLTNQDFYPNSDNDIFLVDFNGGTYEGVYKKESLEEAWGGSAGNQVATCSFELSYLVPVGYDGIVVAFYSATYEEDYEDFANSNRIIDIPGVLNDPNTLYFRLA